MDMKVQRHTKYHRRHLQKCYNQRLSQGKFRLEQHKICCVPKTDIRNINAESMKRTNMKPHVHFSVDIASVE